MELSRLRYNEAIRATSEQQLLLNIVRLRYIDTPSSLSVSSIADQQEIVAGLKAIPFFASAGAGDFGTYRGSVLPQVELSGATRPTLSYTPLDDQEFTRRLFTPISLEGTAYLAKTTWPISTVFRLYLENLNWVSNAETASGPTPRTPPDYAAFREGIDALQRLQDRKLVAIFTEERDERLTDAVAATDQTPTAAIEAVKAGLEYRKDDQGRWTAIRKKQQPVLRIDNMPANDGDWATFCRVFKVDPAQRTLELTTDKTDPFLAGAPEKGLRSLDLETRSLLQVLFFVAHGVDVPAEHLASRIAPATTEPDGTSFDWQNVLSGLFRVQSVKGHRRPSCAHVAIRHNGYWFYIDDRDRDTKATFALLIELSRLELAPRAGSVPILTLPIGGR